MLNLETPVGKTRSSPGAGGTPPAQLAAVPQFPLELPSHVFVPARNSMAKRHQPTITHRTPASRNCEIMAGDEEQQDEAFICRQSIIAVDELTSHNPKQRSSWHLAGMV